MPETIPGLSRPFIIPIFLPNAACPHRCVFCDQKDVTGVDQPIISPEKLNRTIVRYLSYKGPNRHPVQVSFYGGNFLGLYMPTIHRLLAESAKFVSAGLIDGITRLAEHGTGVGLAVSLTSGIEAERRELMPVAGKVPLSDLLQVAADYGRRVRRKVTLECAIIADRNDGLDHARRLLELARTGPFKINLIPLNPIDDFGGTRPDPARLDAMVDLLWGEGILTTVRDSQGRAVDAACGQLVKKQERRPGNAPRGRAV